MRSLLLAVLSLAAFAVPAIAAVQPPKGWPKHFAIGAQDSPGGAPSAKAQGRIDLRYQYLTGGLGSNGWRNWNENGTFVSRYVSESRRARVLPVFTYYQALPSSPIDGDEKERDLATIRDTATLRRYFDDFTLALKRIGKARAVVHVEPDLWGYVQMAARNDDARTVPGAVAFAKRFVRLRNRHAPNVLLAYHLSSWGTNRSHVASNFGPARTRGLARRSARFYRSLGTKFDLVFNDVADRDDGWRVHVNGERVARDHFEPGDFARHDRFLATFTRATRRAVALWQVPVGSSGLPDTWEQYRDNRLEWWLADGNGSHLRRTQRAGVIGLLFGGGADGCTTPRSDGGVFFRLASAYAKRPLRL